MAIALDTTSEGTATANSLTFAHTCTGSNLLLLVGVTDSNGDGVTGVTYNGVAMTQLVKDTAGLSGYRYVYGLLAPATGSNNIVVSDSGVTNLYAVGASYTGVKQSGLPDDTAIDTITSGVNTQADLDFTTTVDGCWSFCITEGDNGSVSAVANATERQQDAADRIAAFDSNGSLGVAGNYTMSTSCAVNSNGGSAGVTFAPAVDTSAVKLLTLLNVG